MKAIGTHCPECDVKVNIRPSTMGGVWTCPVCRERFVVNLLEETRNKVNNGLHGLITLFTCGLWFPVWLIVSFCEETKVLVDFEPVAERRKRR